MEAVSYFRVEDSAMKKALDVVSSVSMCVIAITFLVACLVFLWQNERMGAEGFTRFRGGWIPPGWSLRLVADDGSDTPAPLPLYGRAPAPNPAD